MPLLLELTTLLCRHDTTRPRLPQTTQGIEGPALSLPNGACRGYEYKLSYQGELQPTLTQIAPGYLAPLKQWG